MIVRKTITCDLTGYRLQVIDVSQNDNMSRAVCCRLQANDEPWVVPVGTLVDVAYELQDGTPGRYRNMPDGTAAGVIEGSTVTVMLLDRIMAAAGAVDVSVVLSDESGAQLTTFPFRVNVIGGNKLRNPATYPPLGAAFEGLILFGGPGGVVAPLKLGPGLSIRDGVLYVSGGTDEPDIEIPVSVTLGEDGTILVSPAELVLDNAGTITASEPVTLADDGTIIIGGDYNG